MEKEHNCIVFGLFGIEGRPIEIDIVAVVYALLFLQGRAFSTGFDYDPLATTRWE